MRGTIYYWSNNLGRVLRIKPGAAQPDDFANQAPLNDPAQYAQSSCLMTCHTVSADGSTLVSGGGVFGGSYNLLTGQPTVLPRRHVGLHPNTAGTPVWQNIQWSNPALSPTGKYILTNSMARAARRRERRRDHGFLGMYTTADGQPVASSGLMGVPFSAARLVPRRHAHRVRRRRRSLGLDRGRLQLEEPAAGRSRRSSSSTRPRTRWSRAADARLGRRRPTAHHVADHDPRRPVGPLLALRAPTRATATATSTSPAPSRPTRRCASPRLDGDGYPFAAGARDLSWNFEPSFAPVAAGGYFWVVFTSRRTYGNILTGDKTVVKQLWVAAIDQNPKPGVDPSHPAFHLTGQDEANLAMRGFWALDPCKGDGRGCASGTECCGGYCEPRRGRRAAGVPLRAQRLLPERRQVRRDERLLQRRVGRHLHQPRLLGAAAAVRG